MPRKPRGKRSSDDDGSFVVAAKNSNGDGSVYYEPPSKRLGQLLANTIDANGGHCVLETLPSIGHGGPEARRLAFAATTQFFTATGR